MAGPTIQKDDWTRLQQVINELWRRTSPEGTDGFVDRDAGVIDVTGATINGWTDNIWTQVNLAGVIPAGTKSLLLRVNCMAATTGVQLLFKSHSHTGTYTLGVITQAANVSNRGTIVVATSGLQSIDIKRIGTIDPANCNVTVMGWWT